MIKVDRERVPMPAILRRGTGGPADREFAEASAFYADYVANRQRDAFRFKLYQHLTVKRALEELFHGKCAYCETPILASSPGDIEFYRPKSGVIAADGSLLPHHYWWLAADWSNLYLSCIDCNRIANRPSGAALGSATTTSITPDGMTTRSGKGGRFPLADEACRANIHATGIELRNEQPLLLDPCADDVEDTLLFFDDGLVSSIDEPGLVTIEILGLNRASLVKSRLRTASQLKVLLKTLSLTQRSADAAQINEGLLGQIREMTAEHAPYAGMCRQIVATELAIMKINGGLDFEALVSSTTPTVAPSQKRQAKQALRQFQAKQEDYSLEAAPEDALAAYVSAVDRRIERFSVQNLRAISRLDFPLVERGGRAPWLMLLGENAAGKSTVLQALALALVGQKYRERLVDELELDLKSMVRHGADYGEIHVTLTSATEPRVLRIYADGRIEVSGRDAQLMLLAFGSTRLLPRRKGGAPTGESYARIDNLFDPYTPLLDAQKWLLEASPENFDYAARAIKKALAIDLDHTLVRENGLVGLYERGALVPLGRLCDGYQTVIALVADILSVVLPAWKTPELAQGLVLIDEVGNHLHPSWKLRFVESMREILPNLQVIATTHEPLCLRGLQHGEVAVLRRGARGGINLVSDLPPIEGLRIDQILTSEHFGLASTLDPALQALFEQYHALLRKPELAQVETAKLEELQTRINAAQQLGQTERERRMLEAIDRFIARRVDEFSAAEHAAREAALDEELASIWAEAAERGPSGQAAL